MPARKTRNGQAEHVLVTQRRARAVAMKVAGMTLTQIAASDLYPEGTSKQNVGMDIKRALEDAHTELALSAAEYRELECQRLDEYLVRLLPGIRAGDVKAIDAARRISESRRKLLGLDEPEQVEVITVDAVDHQIRQLRAEIDARDKYAHLSTRDLARLAAGESPA